MPSTLQNPADQDVSAAMLEAVEHQLVKLFVTNAHAKRSFAAKFEEHLPPAAIPVLAMVIHRDQIAQSEICEQVLIDKASLSRLVTRMEEIGLLVRSLDPADRRVSRLSATDMARERWSDMMHAHRARWRTRMNEWPGQDVERLIGLLSRLNEDLRQD